MADFLLYWVPETANYELKVGRPLNHAASQQLRRVQSGDTLWIVTVFHGELTLLGRLVVDDITDTDEARQRLGTDDLWDADYHAIAVAETEEKLSEINLSNIQGQLRFQSVQGKDRLTVTDGRVRPQQLQTMRLLASQSAVLLQRLWEAYRGAWGGERGEIGDFRGAGFGDSEMNRKVEQAAIAVVTDKLARAGWTVTSVEHDRVGYDLCCTRGAEEIHVEVKGISGSEQSFILTAGELRRAKSDTAFRLAVVTQALSEEPRITEYSGSEVESRFQLEPLSYRATLPNKGVQLTAYSLR